MFLLLGMLGCGVQGVVLWGFVKLACRAMYRIKYVRAELFWTPTYGKFRPDFYSILNTHQKAELSLPLSLFVTLHPEYLLKPLSLAGLSRNAHFFPNITVWIWQTLSLICFNTPLLFCLCKCAHAPKSALSFSLTYTHIQTVLHVSQFLSSPLLGEVWSILANPGHRDLRPHPGHSAGYSGAGHLLCQDLCPLQGSLKSAVKFFCIDLIKYFCTLVFALWPCQVGTWMSSCLFFDPMWQTVTWEQNILRNKSCDNLFFFFFLLSTNPMKWPKPPINQ